MDIQLGDLVKDRITGFEGIVVQLASWEHNCDRARVQVTSLDKDGFVRPSEAFDVPQLELMKSGHTSFGVTPDKQIFTFGQKVKHTYTPYEGKVHAIARYLNGCIRVGVISQTLKDGKIQDEEFFPQGELELVEETKEVKEVKKTRTGGPMRDVKPVRMPD